MTILETFIGLPLSNPFQPYSEGPITNPFENDSPVEEVEPVQPKRNYTRRSKPTKKNDKKFVEPWTIEEEIALCQAFVAKSEDSVQGNGKKAAGFRREVVERFHEEIGEDKRSYDSVNCKWKKRIRPKKPSSISFRLFTMLLLTLTGFEILKTHPKWKNLEIPKFYKSKQSSSKNSRTSENTSQENSDSAHIGANLNDEAAASDEVEKLQEVPRNQ
ncbi:hypothetical protein Tco_0582843 [Tanacetum coccineum]